MLEIIAYCHNPVDGSNHIAVSFKDDGWPIMDWCVHTLKREFNYPVVDITLDYKQFLDLLHHLQEHYEEDEYLRFVGDARWFQLGIMAGCGKGHNIFIRWTQEAFPDE